MREASEISELPDIAAQGSRRPWLLLSLVLLPISAFLLVFALTRAFVWDEGYHLIAAQQIARGKLPYIDFCFPQTVLNAYLNAGIMRVFGEFWQPTHVVAALFVIGGMVLIAQYVLNTFPIACWRLACAIGVAALIGLNEIVVQFGPIGQAYAICLFFSVAAFRLALASVDRRTAWLPFASGLFTGISAGSSLLTMPVTPVLLVWLWIFNREGSRVRKCAAFLVGVPLAFLPMLWLFLKAPSQTFFNVVQYHALYRRENWPGATQHDVLILTSWADSTQALALGLLAVVGLIFVVRESGWPKARRAEFYLAAWLTVALGLYIATPHPTFSRYFIFLVPFIAILAMAGLYSVSAKFGNTQRPAWPIAIMSLLALVSLARTAYLSLDDTTWKDYEKIANKVGEVTPPGARLYADEIVYFLLHRDPPSGMEISYSHNLQLPPAREALLHLISGPELRAQVEAGKFDTVQICGDEDKLDTLGLPGPFQKKVAVEDCTVYWDKR